MAEWARRQRATAEWAVLAGGGEWKFGNQEEKQRIRENVRVEMRRRSRLFKKTNHKNIKANASRRVGTYRWKWELVELWVKEEEEEDDRGPWEPNRGPRRTRLWRRRTGK
ncbi:unnamed protein product [Dovyalis caffra]|uniref:Uncharacterized protein n=1 Tax=Dovyalis caffra TaxID=77055 RepID=A0AAV1RBI9_9ROSI|nr:unnamed protein product [Dovyalis caffra]